MQNEPIDTAPPASNAAPPVEATTAPAISSKSDSETPSTPPASPSPDSTGVKAQARNSEGEAPVVSEVPDDTLRLSYEVFLTAGREQVLRVKSLIEFPMALDLENLAQTDVNFPEVLDRILIQPVTTKFHAYIQRRFEVATQIAAEKEAAAQSPPPPAPVGFTIPKPANGTGIVMPEIKITPPTPKMPGGFAQSLPRNGG